VRRKRVEDPRLAVARALLEEAYGCGGCRGRCRVTEATMMPLSTASFRAASSFGAQTKIDTSSPVELSAPSMQYSFM
jgi:hypothetical protein